MAPTRLEGPKPRSRDTRQAGPGRVRVPRQRRAQETVDAILTAARTLLAQHGLAGTTTNAIARRAGVSIGSLYQYFEGLDAIVEELTRRHVAQTLARLFDEAAALRAEPLAQGVRRLIQLIVDVQCEDRENVHLLEAAHRVQVARDCIEQMHDQTMAAARTYLEAHRDALDVDDLDRAAFVVIASVDAVSHGALIRRPACLSQEQLVDELTRLVLRYLTARP